MKVDLFRQLDEWGNHFEDEIVHVNAADVMERRGEPTASARRLNRPRWRTPVRFLGAAALVLVVAAGGWQWLSSAELNSRSEPFSSIGGSLGAGQGQSNAPATTLARSVTTAAAAGTTAAPTTTQAPEVPAAPPVGSNPGNLGRDVIFVGDLAIDTSDVSASVTAARAIVESRGGYVFGQELGGQATVVSLKVPAEFFQDTVDRLSELGTVRNVRITSQDVTERIVDLESQIKTSAASVERLRQLLGEAGTVTAIARVEGELLQRETVLEQLRGQLRTLQEQVSLSTIVLTFRQFVPLAEITVRVGVHTIGNGTGEQCFTRDGSRPARGDSYLVCVDISNDGNVAVTNLELAGAPSFVDAMVPVRGPKLDTLEPGARYVLWTSAVASENLRDEVVVQAIPVDEDGELLRDQIIELRRPLVVELNEPEVVSDGLPALRDALASGWNMVTTGANALAVAIAFMVPFLWIPLIAGFVIWWRRRRA